MPLVKEPLYFFRCDRPGCPHAGYGLASPSREKAAETGPEFGWKVDGEKAFCPSCATHMRYGPPETKAGGAP